MCKRRGPFSSVVGPGADARAWKTRTVPTEFFFSSSVRRTLHRYSYFLIQNSLEIPFSKANHRKVWSFLASVVSSETRGGLTLPELHIYTWGCTAMFSRVKVSMKVKERHRRRRGGKTSTNENLMREHSSLSKAQFLEALSVERRFFLSCGCVEEANRGRLRYQKTLRTSERK